MTLVQQVISSKPSSKMVQALVISLLFSASVGVEQGSAGGKTALAMSGGGFRAFSSDVGVFSGLLAARAKLDGGGSATFADTRLLDKVAIISTVSGSSWFLAQAAYSQSFPSLLEHMATTPKDAGQLFRTEWIAKFLAIGAKANWKMRRITSAARAWGLHFLAQSLDELDYFWQDGLSWTEFNAKLLHATAGVGADAVLGSPVATWAQHKTWLVGHSIVGGTSEKPAFLLSGIGRHIQYTAKAESGTAPAYFPARFSINLGAGMEAAASMPILAEAASGMPIEYSSTGFLGRKITSKLSDLGSSVDSHSGKLLLADVVSASSAFLGGLCMDLTLTAMEGAVNSEFTPWMALGDSSEETAFSKASALVSGLKHRGGSFDELASATVVGAIDGGYTESTGIAQAVAAGATDVVAIIDVGVEDELGSWLTLFQPGIQSQQDSIPILRFPVFQETRELAAVQSSSLQKLALPAGNLFLNALSTGTISATTAESKWFGIEAGRAVKLHIISVDSTLSIGDRNDFNDYGSLVQEVVDCLTSDDNAEIVKDLLKKL